MLKIKIYPPIDRSTYQKKLLPTRLALPKKIVCGDQNTATYIIILIHPSFTDPMPKKKTFADLQIRRECDSESFSGKWIGGSVKKHCSNDNATGTQGRTNSTVGNNPECSHPITQEEPYSEQQWSTQLSVQRTGGRLGYRCTTLKEPINPYGRTYPCCSLPYGKKKSTTHTQWDKTTFLNKNRCSKYVFIP